MFCKFKQKIYVLPFRTFSNFCIIQIRDVGGGWAVFGEPKSIELMRLKLSE